MKKLDCQQGSIQWLEARAGIVTASEAKMLVTPKWKIRTGDTVQTLLATKLAEAWCGPLPGFSSWATEQGKMLEETALPAYEFEYQQKVERVGFILSDDGRCGCSPDGMLDGCGLEVKSLQPVHHVQCLLDGGLPDDFSAQVHFSMFVTGLDRWKLFLYSRRLPTMLLTIERDDTIQDTIQEAVDAFMTDMEIEWRRLVDKNGGPPPPRKAFVPSPESEDNPYVDIIP